MDTHETPRARVIAFEPYRLARVHRQLSLLDEPLSEDAAGLPRIQEVRTLTDAEVAHRRQMLKHLGPR